jgi:hypothetical protein
LVEEWPDSTDGTPVPPSDEVAEVERKAIQGKIPRGHAVDLLGGVLDSAVRNGTLTWDEREAVMAELAKSPARLDEAMALDLIHRWEDTTARMGSIAAAKRDDAFHDLLAMDDAPVIRAALRRLEEGASPHVLVLLHELVGAAPAAGEDTVPGATKAWLDWGRRQFPI